MKFPKKQAQRLIPEYLLDYTTKLNESHPDPTESWGGGSTVVANPTLSGNEATLDGLEVDGTKYKVGGSGEKKYLHIISISYKEIGGFCLNIKTKANTPFTCETLIAYLKELGYTSMLQIMPCAPYRVGNNSNQKSVATGVYCMDNIYLGIMHMRVADGDLYIENGSTDKNYPNFTDTVTEA